VKALVLKDLRLLRPYFWLIVPGHMLFGANGIVRPDVFFGMNVALACAYTAGLLIVEWTQDAERFVGSLPVSREEIVKARYAGALGAAALGTVLYATYGRALLGFGGERLLRRWPGTPGWETPEGLLGFFLASFLLAAAFLPFYFRAGLARGAWLFVACLAPVLVGSVVLVRWSVSGGGEDTTPGDVSARVLTSVFEAVGVVPAIMLFLAAAAALGGFSLRLSVLFFERRDL
jgi:ABC-type transport system involved in multi-copper enzyme maturation permease subunit